VPVVAWLLGRRHPRRGELLFLALLALPMVLAAPFIHPSQGLFRDWDDFAATGVAVSLVVAWLAGEALRFSPRHAWVGVALAVGVAVPAVQWLALHANAERGFARVGALLSEPPRRTPAERAKTWDYVGIVEYRREHWSDASAAFEHSAETGPSYRIMLQWAMATTNGGDLRGAADIYRRMLARYPDAAYAWLGLGAVTSRLADAAPPGEARAAHVAESRRAAHKLLELEPGNREGLALLAYLERRFGAE
jgi:tetratricopeptide (TPR) repeat protein